MPDESAELLRRCDWDRVPRRSEQTTLLASIALLSSDPASYSGPLSPPSNRHSLSAFCDVLDTHAKNNHAPLSRPALGGIQNQGFL